MQSFTACIKDARSVLRRGQRGAIYLLYIWMQPLRFCKISKPNTLIAR